MSVAAEVRDDAERRFRALSDFSPLGLSMISLDRRDFGRYLHTNPAMTAITGYSAAEFERMTYRDLLHPDDLPDEATLREAGARGWAPVRAEVRYRHKDGHVIWVSVHAAAVRDGDGRPLYSVNQVEDVTARRAAEAQLRRQARMLELIPAAVIVRDLDGTIRWWNAGASQLYGWPLEAVHGKCTHRLLGTVFPDHGTDQDLTDALVEGGSWEGQLRHLTAHGRIVTVLSRQVLHSLSDGEPAQVLEINADVTAARAAENALEVSEQRFRAQFTSSAAGQVIRSLDGSLVDVNPAYAAMLGETPARLARVADEDLLHPDDTAEWQRRIAALFNGDAEASTGVYRLRHADGHFVDVEKTVSLVRDEDGHPTNLLGVATDVSERRAAEAAMAERNAVLETADRLKSDIIAMLGHEIANPLSSIRGYAEVLSEDWAVLDEERRRRAVHAITRQAGRLDEIVREVLAMVTIDSGASAPPRAELHVTDRIRHLMATTDRGAVPVRGDETRVLCNPGHLEQMVLNLVSNAEKYGGGVTSVTITSDGTRVRVEVADRGPGVPEDFRSHLFERLARAERDAEHVRGTGLGLYIVRGLARANGGDVTHRPNPAGGALFVLQLEAAS